jgi:hypothetical protein
MLLQVVLRNWVENVVDMRLREFDNSESDPSVASLVTALELIRNRYRHENRPPKISTQSLINLVLNTDKNFNYDALVSANEHNDAVKNLIKSFNRKYVELKSDSESEAPTTNVSDQATTGPVDTVSSMAKRAAKERGASI